MHATRVHAVGCRRDASRWIHAREIVRGQSVVVVGRGVIRSQPGNSAVGLPLFRYVVNVHSPALIARFSRRGGSRAGLEGVGFSRAEAIAAITQSPFRHHGRVAGPVRDVANAREAIFVKHPIGHRHAVLDVSDDRRGKVIQNTGTGVRVIVVPAAREQGHLVWVRGAAEGRDIRSQRGCVVDMTAGHIEVDRVVQRSLIDEREDSRMHRHTRRGLAHWEAFEIVVVVVQGQPQLLEIVLALSPPRGFARLLDGRQQ